MNQQPVGQNPEARQAEAIRLAEAGDYAGAFREWEQTAQLYAAAGNGWGHRFAINGMGTALAQSGQVERGLDLIDSVGAYLGSPADVGGQIRGELLTASNYITSDSLARAHRALDRATTLRPDPSAATEISCLRAEILHRQSRLPEAQKELESVLGRGSDNPGLVARAALLYAEVLIGLGAPESVINDAVLDALNAATSRTRDRVMTLAKGLPDRQFQALVQAASGPGATSVGQGLRRQLENSMRGLDRGIDDQQRAADQLQQAMGAVDWDSLPPEVAANLANARRAAEQAMGNMDDTNAQLQRAQAIQACVEEEQALQRKAHEAGLRRRADLQAAGFRSNELGPLDMVYYLEYELDKVRIHAKNPALSGIDHAAKRTELLKRFLAAVRDLEANPRFGGFRGRWAEQCRAAQEELRHQGEAG